MSHQYKYFSTKTYKQIGPVAYRQWRADSHCNLIHGYAMSFHFEFGSDTVDVRNWLVDFGSLKPLKALLEEWFDHTLLVAADDPQRERLLALGQKDPVTGMPLAKITEVERTGCEGLADFLYRYINDPADGFLKQLGYGGDRIVWCTRIEVRETDANMAGVQGDHTTWDKHWAE